MAFDLSKTLEDAAAKKIAAQNKQNNPVTPNAVTNYTPNQYLDMAKFEPYAPTLATTPAQSAPVVPIAANSKANPNYNPLSQVSDNGTVPFGMPPEDPNATTKAYIDKANAAADMELSRRKTAAKTLYDQTLSNYDAEASQITPLYDQTVKTIEENSFNNSEIMKELMSQHGWGMDNSGLAVGEIGKIGIAKNKNLAKAALSKTQAEGDIARRRSLAKNLLDTSSADADAWKAAQTMGIEAESFLKLKELLRQDYKDKNEKNIADSQLRIQQDDSNIRKESYATEKINLADDRRDKKFTDSIAGRTDIDFSQQIKDNQNDGDTSNDWMIPYIQKGKTNKLNTMEKDYADKSTQYSQDYQQAINDLDKNDPLYVKKVAILKMQQAAKIATQKGDKIANDAANEKIRQYNATLGETMRSNKAGESISQQNANTSATNAANNATNAANKPNATNTNQSFGEDYSELSAMEPDLAAKTLKDNSAELIKAYGMDGYMKLWNQSLASSISAGKFQAMRTTPSTGNNMFSGFNLSKEDMTQLLK